MKKAKSISEIDEYIGSRIRDCRLALGLTQDLLAKALGVSFQQVQNYEKGANGISAVRLFEVCGIFNVSLASMFPPDTRCDPLRNQSIDRATSVRSLPFSSSTSATVQLLCDAHEPVAA
jgi:transcriptional regulator with XRE-family HTH domain